MFTDAIQRLLINEDNITVRTFYVITSYVMLSTHPSRFELVTQDY